MEKRGVSPLISAIMYLIISIIVVGIILNTAVPFLANLNDVTSVNKSQDLMVQLNQTISDVASEGTNSARSITLSIRDSTVTVDGDKELVYLEKKTGADIIASRFRKDIDARFIASESRASAYKTVFNGRDAIVLENDRWKATLLELDKNNLSTDQIIQEIVFKPQDKTLQASVDFYLDDLQNDSDKNVTTTIVREGYLLPRAEAIASIQGETYDYNVHFVLESGADFLRVYATGVDFQ